MTKARPKASKNRRPFSAIHVEASTPLVLEDEPEGAKTPRRRSNPEVFLDDSEYQAELKTLAAKNRGLSDYELRVELKRILKDRAVKALTQMEEANRKELFKSVIKPTTEKEKPVNRLYMIKGRRYIRPILVCELSYDEIGMANRTTG